MKTKIYLLAFIALMTYLLNFLSFSVNAQGGPYYGNNNMMGGNGPFAFFSLFMILIMIFGLLFNLVLAIIVYKDAVKNNNQNAVLMGVLVFFTGIIGLVLYFLLKGSQNNYATSPFPTNPPTNNQSQYRNSFCSICGTQLDGNTNFCPNCGAVTK